MLPQERYNGILTLLNEKEVVKIEELMAAFQVSIETARRDLNYLEQEGLVKKIYGGATLVRRTPTEPLSSDRLTRNMGEKAAIGRKCSEFVADGDSIFLEVGTTTLQVARALKDKKNLTVITNSIYIINELIDTTCTLYVIGGRIRHEERAISGAVSLFELDHFHISKTILGAGAITPENGISDFNIEEALTRKKIIERSKEVYLVADHTKFGFDAMAHVCPISEIDMIVTSRRLRPDLPPKFIEAGVKLVFAD